MIKPLLGIGALLLAISTAACSSSGNAPATASEPRATVELDVYSGRPNPTWDLSGSDSRALKAMLEALPAGPPAMPADALGYRGFLVRFPGEAASPGIKVRKGVVQRGTGASAKFFGDRGGRIETWLLNTGKPILSSETYEYVQKELVPHEPR